MKPIKNLKVFIIWLLLFSWFQPGNYLTGQSLSKNKQNSTADLEYKLLGVRTKEVYDAGMPPGDNAQYMISFACSESEPDCIYQGHDVGGVWVSLNGGREWNNLKNRGLGTRFIIGLEVDPLNSKLVFAMASLQFSSKTDEPYQGLYRSDDGGINWKRVISRKHIKGNFGRSSRNIAFAPSSKNPEAGHAMRWYVAFSERSEDDNNSGDDGFFYSDDAGENWNEVRKLPTSTFGNQIGGLRVDPVNQERVYLYGPKGLYLFTEAANPVGPLEKLSGKNGLPDGDVFGNLYIDQTGDIVIVAVAGKGIFKSTDGGNIWSALYVWDSIMKCFVNEGFPDQIYATGDGTNQVRVSKDGGVTWNTSVKVTPVPGTKHAWNTAIGEDYAWVIPHPLNPNRAFAHSRAKHFQTDNGGDNWYPANDYFCGSQFTGLNLEQMFDPVNPDRFAFFMVDVYINYTENRGLWFYNLKPDKNALNLKHSTSWAGALHPDASKGIILASMGKQNGKLIRSADYGETWELVVPSDKYRYFIGFDQQNPDYCYQYTQRSSDAGATWSELPMPADATICGMSYTDGRVLYAINLMGDRRLVYRSEDRGDTWTEVLKVPWDITSPSDNQYAFRVHPTNDKIIFTKGRTGQITRWNLDLPASEQRTDFDVFNGGTQEADFYASRFAIDRRFPDVMYIMNAREYTGNKFFRSTDGGATWENISEGFPGAKHGGLEVSPLTGEVFISGVNGTRVLLPPYATENTAFEFSAFPNNYISSYEGITINVEESNFEKEINVFPNPTDGFVNIDLGTWFPKAELIITDINGRIIQKDQNRSGQIIPVSLIAPPGVYFITILTENKKLNLRVVKK